MKTFPTDKGLKSALHGFYGIDLRELVPLKGFYDKNYLVKAGRKKFFLKIYGFDKLPAIQFQLSLIDTYAKAGLPVASIIPTVKGDSYFSLGAHRGSLQTCLPGKQLRLGRMTGRLIEEAGSLLGSIHALTKGKMFPGKDWKKYAWDLAQFDIVVRDFRLVRARIPSEMRVLVERVIADWRKQLPNLAKMRKGIIHGDYHGGNILVAHGKCSGVVDFGDAIRSWYAGDVAIALAHLCFKGKKDPQGFIQAFLAGYGKYFLLNSLEMAALPLLIRMRSATAIVELVKASKDEERGLYKKMFEEQVNVLNYFVNA